MSNVIDVNLAASENDAEQIRNVASCLQRGALNPRDDKTTLSANAGLHVAFELSQSLIGRMGAAVDQEAANIRSTGAAFEQYDQMLASLFG